MFELACPLALLCIPIPLIYWYGCTQAKAYLPIAVTVPFFDAMTRIASDTRHLASSKSLLIPALIWIMLVVALACPRWVGAPRPITREGHNIMMALDLSGSMELTDMVLQGRPASRLTVVKRAAEQFVTDRSGDKIGLILFGTRAYLQTPLTYDRHTILTRLQDATAGLAGKTTSMGDAIGLAVKRLLNAPVPGRVLIMLTDGANNSGVLSPLKAAELASDAHIKIYTIGLGAEAQPLSSDFLIPNGGADLDEETLKNIANKTGGQYFRATDTETLHKIYQTINQLETISQEQVTIRPQIDYAPWCIAFAIVLFFYWLASKTHWIRHGSVLIPATKELGHD
jgi:Ca-activated chloride channel homolog